MEVEVAQLENRFVDAWIAMRHELYGDERGVHEEEAKRFLAGALPGLGAVLIATRGGEAIGFAELSVRPSAEGCSTSNVGYLEGWFVKDGHRGEGIGRKLVEASLAWAKDRGCREFASDAEITNERSRTAHLACGFDEVGVVCCFRRAIDGVVGSP